MAVILLCCFSLFTCYWVSAACVRSTKGHAQGTAVGFNKAKKGARSYYPLFCTVAQTDQFFDVYHRPDNVHDSNGAAQFMLNCFEKAKQQLKRTKKQRKGPILLHLFEPRDFQFDYKVIVTNKTESAISVVLFLNGSGSQEAIFGNAKTDTALGVIPCRQLAANQTFTLCAMMAHNLSRQV